MNRRGFVAGSAGLLFSSPGWAAPDWGVALATAARTQIGQTVSYDGGYARLAYPGGDVPRERGVCTDVIVRAYRDAFGLDLQKLVHEDMRAAFSSYPRLWALTRPDRSIDHRRVPNLETYLKRRGAALTTPVREAALRSGDLITQRLPGNLPHILIVDRQAPGRPLGVHNIGAGTRLEDALFDHPVHGHFRFPPPGAEPGRP